MDTLTLIFLLYGLNMALSFHDVIYEYHAIDLQMTWFEAQQYCREHYTDLATFRNMDDINSFQRPSSFTGVAWIGLFDDPASWKSVMGNDSNSWRWSSTGTTSPGGYQNWKTGEPNHYQAREHCGVLNNGLWGDIDCETRRPFVCFTDSTQGPKQYTFISTTMTWEEAQSYCREHHTDLAMIEDETENSDAASVLVPNQWVWFGLYRKPWRWSDGSESRFTNWASGQPNNVQGQQHCVWEDDNRLWNDVSCSYTHAFVCIKAFKTETHQFSLKLESDVDLSDPTYSMQTATKLVTVLKDKGLTDLNIRWKGPPQKTAVVKKDVSKPSTCYPNV